VAATFLGGLLAGCAGVSTGQAEASVTSASPPTTPEYSPTPHLPPPPEDAAVVGPLSRAALPALPPLVSPRGGSGSGRTGPFTLRSYVHDFYNADEQLLSDLRLMRFKRGYHRFATAPDGSAWMHIYLFECQDNRGASGLQSMLFGDPTAEPYQPRHVGDALGEVVRTRDDRGPYSKVEIVFADGNVWSRVIVGFRGGAARTRLAERLAERLTVAQRHLLESRFAPAV
jgi:hypothetical protein